MREATTITAPAFMSTTFSSTVPPVLTWDQVPGFMDSIDPRDMTRDYPRVTVIGRVWAFKRGNIDELIVFFAENPNPEPPYSWEFDHSFAIDVFYHRSLWPDGSSPKTNQDIEKDAERIIGHMIRATGPVHFARTDEGMMRFRVPDDGWVEVID